MLLNFYIFITSNCAINITWSAVFSLQRNAKSINLAEHLFVLGRDHIKILSKFFLFHLGSTNLKSAKTLGQLKSLLGAPQLHLEIQRDEAEEARDYTKKDGGAFSEKGSFSATANDRRRANSESREEDCCAIVNAVKAKMPQLALLERYPHLASSVQQLYELRPARSRAPSVLYLYSSNWFWQNQYGACLSREKQYIVLLQA